MGLFDLDYDPFTGKKKKTDSQQLRGALTPAKKRRITEAVGNKCEIRGCQSDAYDVHHIKPVSKGGTNVGSNLIMLCANHHRDAHNGKITRAKLRNVVKNRSKRVKQEINTILRDRKKVGSEKTVSSSDVSPIFNSPSFNSPFDTTPKKKDRKKKKDNDPWWI